MSRIAKIEEVHLSTSGTFRAINNILLSCAILQSRQRMTSEVSFTVSIDGKAENRNIRLDLDLAEDSEVKTCLEEIYRRRQADNNITNGLAAAVGL